MERRHSLPLLALCALAIFSSCEKEAFNPESNNDKVESTKDLTVPADFDWSTTQNLSYNIIAPVNTVIDIYTEKGCAESSLLMSGISLTANEAEEVSLMVPSYLNNIYVKYPTAEGFDVLEVSTQSEASTRTTWVVNLPGKTTEKNDDNTAFNSYFPSKGGYATMMFEDLYPSKGDYDFNDFVIRYNVHIKDLKQPTTAGENFIKMKFQICAMGGSLPYQPAIRLQGITTGFAKQATLTNEPSPEGLAVQLIDSRADNSDAIFLITGTEALRKKGFCNTYPDKISNDLPTVSFTLAKPFTDKKEHEWKELKKLRNNFDKNFDCFIYNPETKMEIHANIFKPTDMSENTDMEYRSEEGLVWAISVPAAISFPAEKIDIINAFSGFKKWVTSNGKNDTDWYIKPSNSPEFPIITLEAK